MLGTAYIFVLIEIGKPALPSDKTVVSFARRGANSGKPDAADAAGVSALSEPATCCSSQRVHVPSIVPPPRHQSPS